MGSQVWRAIIVTPEIGASRQTHADTALCVRVCLPLGHVLSMGVGLLPVCVLSFQSTCESASVAKTKNTQNPMIPKKIRNKDFYACSKKPEQIESVIDRNAFDVDWRCFWQQLRRLTRGPLLPGMPGFPGAPGSPWRE